MTHTITIRKGLDLPIAGAAELRLSDARGVALYAVKPTDFVGLVPRLLVEEGQRVEVGEALLCDKNDPRIRLTSPVSGKVKAIVRGEKRKLLEVVVEAEGKAAPTAGVYECPQNAEALKALMLQCGLWPMLRQRPFGTIAQPNDKPKAIFVSAFSSVPLAPNYDFVMQGREAFLKKGLEALCLLTEGMVHVCFKPGQKLKKCLDCFVPRNDAKRQLTTPHSSLLTPNSSLLTPNCQLSTHEVQGPHPAGNIGTQIAHIDPINKGEVVWTMNVQDVAVLGELVSTGIYNPVKVVAVAGPQASNPHYYRVKAGACLESLLAGQLPQPNYPRMEAGKGTQGSRIISGDVLSGTKVGANGFLGAYDDLVSLLPEGDYYDFMGWLMPGFKKYSYSRTFLSGFLPKDSFKPFGMRIPRFSSFWKFDTNTHGDQRPLVFTGDFERVFPFRIYPTQLIKACIVGDIELMEQLGIYEVEPEDFALCEFIDVSKTDLQSIVRDALETLRKEER